MKKFAYLDYAGILHITRNEEIAKSHAKNGKYIATEIPAEGGYPINRQNGSAYILYSEKEEKHGYDIPEELAKLYTSLR